MAPASLGTARLMNEIAVTEHDRGTEGHRPIDHSAEADVLADIGELREDERDQDPRPFGVGQLIDDGVEADLGQCGDERVRGKGHERDHDDVHPLDSRELHRFRSRRAQCRREFVAQVGQLQVYVVGLGVERVREHCLLKQRQRGLEIFGTHVALSRGDRPLLSGKDRGQGEDLRPVGGEGRTVGREGCRGQILEDDLSVVHRYGIRIDGGMRDAGEVQLRERLPDVVELRIIDVRRVEFGQPGRIGPPCGDHRVAGFAVAPPHEGRHRRVRPCTCEQHEALVFDKLKAARGDRMRVVAVPHRAPARVPRTRRQQRRGRRPSPARGCRRPAAL